MPEATPSVRLRALVSWDLDAGIAFASAAFDVILAAVNGGHSDGTGTFVRPAPFNNATGQTIVATRFASVLKVDDARDTLPPGEGQRGVNPAQLSGGTSGPDRLNPASIFEFDVFFDGTPGRREVSEFFLAPAGGNSTDRVLRVYTNDHGALNHPLTTRHHLTINVIPAPASLGLLVPLLALHRRRRQ